MANVLLITTLYDDTGKEQTIALDL